MPNLLQKTYAPEKIFKLHQYSIPENKVTDFSKEADDEKLAKIASELSILETI